MVIILLIGLFILFYPIRLKVQLTYLNDSMDFDISLPFLGGFFKPRVKSFDDRKKFKFHARGLLEGKNKKIVQFIWRKLALKKFVWKTKIGLSDAALTSFVYGIIWSFKTYILNLVLKGKKIESIALEIIPIFNEDRLDVELNCIFEIKLVHIIIVWVWLLKTYKGGDKVDRASNRRLNEDYNE
ncbi:MAG TPA: DUF2953 domain-containing protein [Tepidimicrobium sp.]|nr:DUF2953 domain-containing protein [Tepidimicrobium sp.]